MFHRRRRDQLIVQLAGQLADSRAREAKMAERLEWFEAALADSPFVSAEGGQPARRSPLTVVHRSAR